MKVELTRIAGELDVWCNKRGCRIVVVFCLSKWKDGQLLPGWECLQEREVKVCVWKGGGRVAIRCLILDVLSLRHLIDFSIQMLSSWLAI